MWVASHQRFHIWTFLNKSRATYQKVTYLPLGIYVAPQLAHRYGNDIIAKAQWALQDVHVLSSPFNRQIDLNQINQSEFSLTWSCVSLTRSTTSSEWKLFRFDKIEVNCFQILLIDAAYIRVFIFY